MYTALRFVLIFTPRSHRFGVAVTITPRLGPHGHARALKVLLEKRTRREDEHPARWKTGPGAKGGSLEMLLSNRQPRELVEMLLLQSTSVVPVVFYGLGGGGRGGVDS